MKKNKKKGSNLIAGIIVALIGIVVIGAVPADVEKIETNNDKQQPSYNENIDSQLKISYIDVGQADCILIQNEDKNMIIDAGNNEDGKLLVKYFEGLGIEKFDIVVGTHPHEDHIGGLDNVIEEFDIGQIYMPKVMTTTATFEDVLDAVASKNMSITSPKEESKFEMGDCRFTIISAKEDDKDLNNSSIVLRLDFGKTSYLFTGDMEEVVEQNILSKDIDVDVLKVGHHGSSTSTSNKFLQKVSPKYAIICVGEGNSYGHPHKEIIERLNDSNIDIYRTDENGTIILNSDGEDISFNTIKTNTDGNIKVSRNEDKEEKEQNNQNENVNNSSLVANEKNIIVYVTESGTKYHKEGCRYLNNSKIEINLDNAIDKYGPCKTCNPPTR